MTTPTNPSAMAATALSLLLSEDPLLTQHKLATISTSKNSMVDIVNEEAAFSYAAALLTDDSAGWMSSSGEVQQRAAEALAEVDRKLALVQSLYERVARESPEAVAGPLLKLHGYRAGGENEEEEEEEEIGSASLMATRERCDRLKRQGEVLEGVARRVESSLSRGLRRMEGATCRLRRVLELSSTLKMAMRLQFEAKKVQGSGIDFEALTAGVGLSAPPSGSGSNYYAAHSMVDLRDLTRAAASVAAMEQLLSHPSLSSHKISVVESLRPEADKVAKAVRRAAAGLLKDQHHSSISSRLGATLQVYFHLDELPQAVWGAVADSLASAEKASSQFFNPAALQRMHESAAADAKLVLEAQEAAAASAGGGGSSKKKKGADMERELKKKLREKRAEAAAKWAAGVADASLQVWNLHRVLMKKSDPVTRLNFLDVFSEAEVPKEFRQAEAALLLGSKEDKTKNLFAIYWNQVSIGLGARIQRLLKYDNGSIARDVAALYPAVRAAALNMLGTLGDAMQAGMAAGDDATNVAPAGGILGGSSGLDDATIMGWPSDQADATAQPACYVAGPDSWTHDPVPTAGNAETDLQTLGPTPSSSSITSGAEWKALQGSNNTGLCPLQRAFLESCRERLCAPLQYLFPEAVSVDEDGVAIPCLPTIPSRYDIAKLDASIRDELALADPREGGGEFGMTTMITDNIVDMVERFCGAARGATSGVGEDGYLHKDGSATESLKHDQKLIIAMNTLSTLLRNAPDKTFLAPYCPAQLPQHEEAARTCQIALLPALNEIQTLVKTVILSPLCRALNKRVSSAISKMHRGTYLETTDTEVGTNSSFVQTHLTYLYEDIAAKHLVKLPNEYASIVATTIATFSIYAFVSNASLIRPLGETGRLKITQDLADLELALEQFVFKGGTASTLGQMDHGRPYAELRAVRQMLFWTGFDTPDSTPTEIAKRLLRELWTKDVRPSTVFHYLVSHGPILLSSPHHAKKMNPQEYVGTLVSLDGAVEDGEASAWMTTMACCDAYQQRESVEKGGGGDGEGDRRVAQVLMMVGPELLRRRRQ